MPGPILVVSLNPALDITHHVADVDWDGVNRPAEVRSRAGGKGVNVARTLRALSAEVRLAGLAGGATGAALQAEVAEAGIPAAFTRIAGETRRSFTIVDTGRALTAVFNEPGPDISAAEYERFLAGYAAELAGSAAVVLTGSLPPGIGPASYAELTTMAARAGVPVVLDAGGEVLRLGAAAGAAIVKPNRAELEQTAGQQLTGLASVAAAARELIAAGARAAVVSLGPDGLLALTGSGSWQALPPAVAGNPTGAGDAVVAGLALGLTRDWTWPDRLRHAAALGTATAAAPVAGQFDLADYDRLCSDIPVPCLKGL